MKTVDAHMLEGRFLINDLRIGISRTRATDRALAASLVRAHLFLAELQSFAIDLPAERHRWWHRICPPFLTRRRLMSALTDLQANLAAGTAAATTLGATVDRAVAVIASAEDSPALAAAAATAAANTAATQAANDKLAAALPAA